MYVFVKLQESPYLKEIFFPYLKLLLIRKCMNESTENTY